MEEMKKLVLIIAMSFVLISAKAQLRTSTIYKKRNLVMMLHVNIESNDSSYFVASRDLKYYSVVDYVKIASGDKEEVKETLLFYKGVIKSGEGYSDQLGEFYAMYSRNAKQTAYISNKGDSGYTYININAIDKLLEIIE